LLGTNLKIMKKILFALLLAVIITPTAFAKADPLNLPVRQSHAEGQVNEISEQEVQISHDDPLYNPAKGDPQFHTTQNVTYEVLEGEYKGSIFKAVNDLTGQIYDVHLKKGDKVMLLLKTYKDGTFDGYAIDFIRNNTMIIFGLLFGIGLILIGKLKGLKALISLVITVAAIFFILIPFTLQGYDPLWLSILISIAVTFVTIYLIAGFNKKALSAIIGTIIGVLCAAAIAYIVGKMGLLTGLSGENARILYINRPDLNFTHIFFASIIIGALGAVMDVGMSIASSINEIHQANKNATRIELFQSGMQVGKDIMGTMSNTLILAYVGSSLPLVLLFSLNNFTLMHIINFDFIAAEIVRSISGSFGLLFAIPITALVSSFLMHRKS